MFEKQDYKAILAEKIEENRGVRGYQKALALACQCHTSFISQVLKSHIQLTPDHAASLCEFWRLSQEETDYFIALVNYARSGTVAYRRHLKQQLDSLRKNRKSVSARVGKKAAEIPQAEAQQYYYSSWQVMAIHVLTSVPGFSSVEAIAQRLSLPASYVATVLKQLVDHGYLKQTGNGYRPSDADLHLSSQSVLVAHHHRNWRNYATHHVAVSHGQGTHYSGVLAIARNDAEKIQEMLLEFLENAKAVAVASREEDVYCLNLDLFAL